MPKPVPASLSVCLSLSPPLHQSLSLAIIVYKCYFLLPHIRFFQQQMKFHQLRSGSGIFFRKWEWCIKLFLSSFLKRDLLISIKTDGCETVLHDIPCSLRRPNQSPANRKDHGGPWKPSVSWAPPSSQNALPWMSSLRGRWNCTLPTSVWGPGSCWEKRRSSSPMDASLRR